MHEFKVLWCCALQEAWHAYVQGNFASMLAAALKSESELAKGAVSCQESTPEQALVEETSASSADCKHGNDEAEKDASAALEDVLTACASSMQSGDVDSVNEVLWSALAASAKRDADQPEASESMTLIGACSDFQEHSLGINEDGDLLPHFTERDFTDIDGEPWSGAFGAQCEPPIFNGTFRAQRARRTVRVVRGGSRAAPSKGNPGAKPSTSGTPTHQRNPAAERGAAMSPTSEPGRPAAISDCCTQRTRKKRAAASLVESDSVSLHTPLCNPAAAQPQSGSSGSPAAQASRQSSSARGQTEGTPAPAACRGAGLHTPAHDVSGLCSPLRSQAEPQTSPVSGVSLSPPLQKPAVLPEAASLPLQAAQEGLSEQASSGSRTSGSRTVSVSWGHPPILLAAATGRADILRQLLRAPLYDAQEHSAENHR